jgi:hypothetical protein
LAYLGNRPAESFASFEKQVFTIVNSQTAYTLSHSVTNENDIRLVVNNVVQEPGSGKAYTASGTTLTLSAALTNGTDTMYCVFLGRALQTVNPPNASVGSAQVADNLISGKTALGATPADTDELLISDAGTLKRVDYSYLKSANTPAFEATITTEQNPSDNTYTLINFDSEIFDTASAYDTSNKRFTVPSGQAGKYFIYSYSTMGSNTNSDLAEAFLGIYKNGSRVKQAYADFSENKVRYSAISVSNTFDLSAGDYIEMYGLVNIVSGSAEIRTLESTFGGYKIIE